GADALAGVAAEEVVADALAQLHRHGAPQLDGQVRDALAGIEDIRRLEGVGRAGIETGGAASAALADGGAGRERERGDDLADEHVGAEAGGDEHAVLADEAEAGAGGPGALEN